MGVCGDAYSFLGSCQAGSVTISGIHSNHLHLSLYFFICEMGLEHCLLG